MKGKLASYHELRARVAQHGWVEREIVSLWNSGAREVRVLHQSDDDA